MEIWEKLATPFAHDLSVWGNTYGWDSNSLNDFANTRACSYDEYMKIWDEIVKLQPYLEEN